MKNLKKLHNLILGMNRSERRYFKQRAKSYSSTNELDYIALFDVLAKYSNYSEVITNEVAQIGINNLSLKIQYLHNAILDSLSAYKKKRSPNQFFQTAMNRILLLEQLGQLEDALKMIKKIKQKAYEGERFELLLQMLDTEKSILHIRDHGQTSQQLIEMYNEKHKLIRILSNLNKYELLGLHFIELLEANKVNESLDQKAFQDLLDHSLLQSESLALSTRAKFQFYRIKSVIYFFLYSVDDKNFYTYSSKCLQLLHNVKSAELHPGVYFNLFNNYFIACFHQKEYEPLKRGLSFLQNITPNEPQYFAICRYFYLGFMSSIYKIQPPPPNEKTKFLNTFKKDFDNYKHLFHQTRKKLLLYNVVSLCISFKEYSTALDWWNILSDPEEVPMIPKEKLTIKLTRLILLYELNYRSLIKSELSSLNYFLKKLPLDTPMPQYVFSLFKNLFNVHSNEEKINILSDFLSNLPAPSTYHLTYLKIIPQWVNAKLSELQDSK